jgi:2-polyprenyl-3-methyl-5-hydroxy-6-metoxy-1,4-benzoquinol methylase
METLESCMVCHGSRIETLDAEWHFCRCGACGYVFDSPRPTYDELVAFYSRPTKYDHWVREGKARDALWKRRLKMLLPHRQPGSLLDVGTGIGQFLHHAKPFFSQVRGTEVSESAIATAREKYGLLIDRGQVEEMNLPAASFDNLTLFHVLEHVPNPVKLVETCHRLLRPNGILVVAVPNDVLAWTSKLKKLGKRFGLKPFGKFSPILGISRAGLSREIHLSHFTPAVLRQLLLSNGFGVVAESIDPYYVARGPLALVHGIYYFLHKAMFDLFRANRYDTIWMIVRKKERNDLSATNSVVSKGSSLRNEAVGLTDDRGI